MASIWLLHLPKCIRGGLTIEKGNFERNSHNTNDRQMVDLPLNSITFQRNR